MKALSLTLLFLFSIQILPAQKKLVAVLEQGRKWEVNPWEDKKLTEYEYDEWGNMTEERILTYSKELDNWKDYKKNLFTYDDNDEKIGEQNFKMGKDGNWITLNQEEVFTNKNSSENEIIRRFKKDDHTFHKNTRFTFYPDGRQDSIITVDAKYDLRMNEIARKESFIKYIYEDSLLLEHKTIGTKNESGKWEIKPKQFIAQYDENGKCIMTISRLQPDKLPLKIENTYYPNGDNKKKSIYHLKENEWVLSHYNISIREYNKKGQIIKVQEEFYNNGESEPKSIKTTTFKYKNGKLWKEEGAKRRKFYYYRKDYN